MASLRYERRIAAPAEEVWAIIRDPSSIPQWFPGITSCTVDGSVRVIETAIGVSMPEEIITVDDHVRRFAYRITAPMFTSHLGTIDVFAIGPRDSLCVYSTTAEPDTMALLVGGGTDGALEEIKRLAESARG